jgi:hypothetical protein
MLNNLKKLLLESKSEFSLGKKVAEDRIILAKNLNRKFKQIKQWNDSYDFLRRKNFKYSQIFIGCLGYAYGTFTTFCPLQTQLDNFDNESKLVRSFFINPIHE